MRKKKTITDNLDDMDISLMRVKSTDEHLTQGVTPKKGGKKRTVYDITIRSWEKGKQWMTEEVEPIAEFTYLGYEFFTYEKANLIMVNTKCNGAYVECGVTEKEALEKAKAKLRSNLSKLEDSIANCNKTVVDYALSIRQSK